MSYGFQENSPSWTRSISSALGNIGRRAWHLIYLLGVLAAFAAFGTLAGIWIYSNILKVGEGVTIWGSTVVFGGIDLTTAAVIAVPLTVALTAWKDVGKVLLSIWEALTKVGAAPKVIPDALGVSALAAYAAIAWLTAKDGQPLEPPTVAVTIRDEVNLMIVEPHPAARLRYLFPLAETKDRKEPSDFSRLEFTKGHTFADGSPAVEDISTLTKALGACAKREDAKAVEIRIAGYADQNEFRDWSSGGSDEANRQLANLRARALHSLIDSVISAESLNIRSTLVEWKSIDDMRSDPAYLSAQPLRTLAQTTGHSPALLDQGQFNRRADIELIDLSDCRRITEKRPT